MKKPLKKPRRPAAFSQEAPKRRSCRFCADKVKKLDYKDISALRRFISERGKILPRRITRICDKHQRLVTRAIKQARNIALLPFTVE
ncbi:MAG: 30S ribosomal protein S18 [bacterium]